MKESRPSIAIVGAGRVGAALGLLLAERGYPVVGVYSRSTLSAHRLARQVGIKESVQPEQAAAGADLVFITTPDREIVPVTERIASAGGFRPGQVVAHTCGALASGIMQAAAQQGALIISIHPLQSFTDVEAARQNLPGSYFALEGDGGALAIARLLVRDLGGRSFTINAAEKPLYHAAACVASNYLVSLMHLATSLYKQFGLTETESVEALMPLIQGTLRNISRLGVSAALTGPVSRGDVSTVAEHMHALGKLDPSLNNLYAQLGLYTVDVAMEKGNLHDAQVKSLSKVLREAIINVKKGDYCRLSTTKSRRKTNYHGDRLRLPAGPVS